MPIMFSTCRVALSGNCFKDHRIPVDFLCEPDFLFSPIILDRKNVIKIVHVVGDIEEIPAEEEMSYTCFASLCCK